MRTAWWRQSQSYITTDGQPASLSRNKAPIWAYDQILIIVWQLRVCGVGAPSLTRGRVCRLQLLLVLASAVIFRSESRRTRGQFYCLRFETSFSSPPTTRRVTVEVFDPASTRVAWWWLYMSKHVAYYHTIKWTQWNVNEILMVVVLRRKRNEEFIWMSVCVYSVFELSCV
jgi:hypothetical protein